MMKFDAKSYMIYQLLPDSKKIEFLMESIDGDVDEVTTKFYTEYFSEVAHQNSTELLVITLFSDGGNRVNVIFDDWHIHVNSNSEEGIESFSKTLFDKGYIMESVEVDPEIDKIFHLKYHKCFHTLNQSWELLPINYN